MSIGQITAYSAAAVAVGLAFVAIVRPQRSTATWFFMAGMLALAANSALDGISLGKSAPDQWIYLELGLRSIMPPIWLCFSLAYSRGNYREFLLRWRFILIAAFLLPLVLLVGFQDELFRALPPGEENHGSRFGPVGTALNSLFLITVVLILTNLEKTFRTAVGTMRWRIKFVVLGLCVIFGARIYVGSQILLYSSIDPSLAVVEAAALLIGCGLIAVSYARAGLIEIDVYPSHVFLYSSITIVLAGVYLLIVGLLAKVAVAVGGDTSFPIKAFFLLIGIVGLAVLLLSDRLRQRTQRFISFHFKRPLYDYRKVWALFTEKAASATNPASLCSATAKLISETFNILSVTIWMVDENENKLVCAASTALLSGSTPEHKIDSSLDALLTALRENSQPFNLDTAAQNWAESLRQLNPASFRKGGNRICVPIVASDRTLGMVILADRVGGLPFSLEELDLLRCIGSHIAASLLSLQLADKLMEAKEQEAFRAVSAFFAHDLKNAASTLSLMLKNLPLHFEDPSFREDVLRGIAKTVNHMNHLINRLSVLRQKPELKSVPADLNDVVSGALSRWEVLKEIELIKNFEPLPKLPLDPEQIQNVVTNLVLNARDAVNQRGHIHVQTARQNGWAVLTVSDDGCGMTPEFLRQSLFRPFQTTKNGGTGIGMFQCKMIVEAHHGRIEVESEPGKGTSFRVLLPLTAQSA
jgi:putative PEP-CTERM system histidine kinase